MRRSSRGGARGVERRRRRGRAAPSGDDRELERVLVLPVVEELAEREMARDVVTVAAPGSFAAALASWR